MNSQDSMRVMSFILDKNYSLKDVEKDILKKKDMKKKSDSTSSNATQSSQSSTHSLSATKL